MTEGRPRIFDPDQNIPDSVVYDIFSDTAVRLGGEYVYIADHTDDPDKEEYWITKNINLRDEKEAVDPDDRASLVEHVNRWNSELNQLRSG